MKQNIYSKGLLNSPFLDKTILSVKQDLKSKDKKVYLIFDLDGVLVPAGIETPVMNKSLEQFFKEEQKTAQEFKKELLKLKKKGFLLGINTGRGVVFARRIIARLFPEKSSEKIICEGGAIILEERIIDKCLFERRTYPKSVKIENVNLLEMHKGIVITHALKNLHGRLEGGKELIISLNAPDNEKIEPFFTSVNKFVKKIGLENKIEVSHSATAVDITPKGADKLKALKEILSGDKSFYFGDAPSDEDAMKISIGNIVPANGADSTKKQAKNSHIGILPEREHLFGVVDSLKNINSLFK